MTLLILSVAVPADYRIQTVAYFSAQQVDLLHPYPSLDFGVVDEGLLSQLFDVKYGLKLYFLR